MEHVKCDLCGSDDASLLFAARDINLSKKGLFNIVRCKKCGLVYVNPRPTKQEIGKFYPDTYFPCPADAREAMDKYQYERLGKIKKIKKTGKILDVGCGAGYFLAVAKENGWDTRGVEVSKIAADYAKKKFSLDIFVGELRNATCPDEYFDVVTLWHVLAHLPNPSETLAEVNRVLKKNGLLVLTVPNISGFQAKIFKEFWFHLDVPRHLYFFEPNTLKQMLRKNGFKILKVNHFSSELEAQGLIYSMLNVLRPRGGAGKKKSATAKPRQGAHFAKSVYPLVKGVADFLSYFPSAFGRGATMEAYCTKTLGCAGLGEINGK